jgi:hypothetical protein
VQLQRPVRLQLADGSFALAIGVPVLSTSLSSSGMDVTLDTYGANLSTHATQGEKVNTKTARAVLHTPPPSPRKGPSAGMLIGIAIGGVVLLAAAVAAMTIALRRRQRAGVTPSGSGSGSGSGHHHHSGGFFQGTLRALAPEHSAVPATDSVEQRDTAAAQV